MDKKLGIAGRISSFFQEAHLTPLLALIAILMGIFAVLITPREEEPQINVTMANVIVPFPGAAVRDVERRPYFSDRHDGRVSIQGFCQRKALDHGLGRNFGSVGCD